VGIMRELLFGNWGPELIAYGQQNPLRALSCALTAVSLVLMILFGKFSWSGDGTDAGDFGDCDGGGGE
jgi:hypothetical protein